MGIEQTSPIMSNSTVPASIPARKQDPLSLFDLSKPGLKIDDISQLDPIVEQLHSLKMSPEEIGTAFMNMPPSKMFAICRCWAEKYPQDASNYLDSRNILNPQGKIGVSLENVTFLNQGGNKEQTIGLNQVLRRITAIDDPDNSKAVSLFNSSCRSATEMKDSLQKFYGIKVDLVSMGNSIVSIDVNDRVNMANLLGAAGIYPPKPEISAPIEEIDEYEIEASNNMVSEYSASDIHRMFEDGTMDEIFETIRNLEVQRNDLPEEIGVAYEQLDEEYVKEDPQEGYSDTQIHQENSNGFRRVPNIFERSTGNDFMRNIIVNNEMKS